jgi:hypothetical protein
VAGQLLLRRSPKPERSRRSRVRYDLHQPTLRSRACAVCGDAAMVGAVELGRAKFFGPYPQVGSTGPTTRVVTELLAELKASGDYDRIVAAGAPAYG